MSKDYIPKLIGHVIEANTGLEAPSPDAVRALQKCFQNPKQIDTAYKKVIERLETNKKHTSQITAKCIRLLKSELLRYFPSDDTLIEIDKFCQRFQTVDEDERKSLSYIRAIIARVDKQKQRGQDLATSTGSNTHKTRSNSRHESKKSIKTSGGKRTKRRTRDDKSNRDLIANMMFLKLSKPSPSRDRLTFVNFPLFGGQFPSPNLSKQEVFSIDNDHLLERLSVVSMSKKTEERQMYRSYRRSPSLFQYKYYKSQSRLDAGPQLIESLLEAVVHPDNNQPPEARLTAYKLLIKLFIDVYCEDGDVGTAIVMQVMTEMLQTGVLETTLQAFNVLFNLTVHLQMLEEVPFFDVDSDGTTHKINRYQDQLFGVLKESLVLLIHQNETRRKVWFAAMNILLYFVASNGQISREKVMCLDGRILPAFFNNIDYISDEVYRNLVRMLINYVYIEVSPYNSASSPPPSDSNLPTTFELDAARLTSSGGISFVISLYLRSRSPEANDNLFTLIYDFVVLSYNRRKTVQPSNALSLAAKKEEEIAQFMLIFELLQRLEASHYFTQLFKTLPDGFVERVLKFIATECAPKSTATPSNTTGSGLSNSRPSSPGRSEMNSMQRLYEKIDKSYLQLVVGDLAKLVLHYNKLPDEFDVIVRDAVTKGELNDSNGKILSELVNSALDSDRKYGETMLVRMKREISRNPQKYSAPFVNAVDGVFNKLITSQSPKVRRVYLAVTEKLILSHKGKMLTHGEEPILNEMFKLLNDNLTTILAQQENNEQNLMYMFDIIFNLIKYTPIMSEKEAQSLGAALGHMAPPATEHYHLYEISPYHHTNNPLGAFDVRERQFIEGRVWIPRTHLQRLAVGPLRDIFLRLPSRLTSLVRVMLLYLLIDKCKDSKTDMQTVGGNSFFKNLLDDNDPQISFMASRFLIDKLQQERPDQFKDIVNTLLDKAVQANDEKLMNNPYLQIKAIMQMKDRKNRNRLSFL